MRLKRFIISSGVLVIIVPIIIISVILLTIINNTLREEAYNKNQMLARVTANQVAEKMNTPYVLLKQIRDQYVLHEADEQALTVHMASIIQNYSCFESIELVDKSGGVKAVAPFNDSIMNIDRSRQDFFKEIKQGKQVYWSQSFLSIQTGRPIVVLAIPAGEMILVGYLSLEDISRLSGYFKEKYGNGVSVSITDQNGVLLSHNNFNYVLERRNEDTLKQLRGKLLDKPQIVSYGGRNMLVSLQTVDNLRWNILVFQEENFAYALLKKITAIFVITIFCALVLVMYFSRYKFNSILDAFEKLKQEMDIVSRGAVSNKISHGLFDEFNELADVFNRMNDSIKERQEREFIVRQVAMMVLANDSLEKIANFICTSISRMLNLSFAWVAWANPDGSITAYAASELAKSYLQGIKYRWDDTPAGSGPVGLSIRQDKVFKTNVNDPVFRLWAPRAQKFGVGSAVSLPIRSKECIVGSLCLYSSATDYFTAERINQLLTIVQQIDVAISAHEAYRHLNVLKSSLEAAADGILITNAAGSYVWGNNAFEKITGHFLGDISRPGVNIFTDRRYLPAAYYEEVSTVLNSGKVWCGERKNWRPDGTKYFAEVTISPVEDEFGRISHYIFVIHDITDRKQMEEEIETNKNAVARSERLASLGTMASGIAHEINQPLNVIKILSDGIEISHNLGKLDSAILLKRTREISAQVDRIDAIIKHMRALVFNERSDNPVPCDVNQVVEKSLDLLKSQIEAHGIRLTVKLNADSLAMAEELKLEEVIINLVNNAMHAVDSTGQNYKEIGILTRQEGEAIIIEVADNGQGVDDVKKDKIFEPFFTTKKVGEGMGLGLSIAHSIISSFGGKLSIHDNLPAGALFRIKLQACCETCG